MHHHAEVWVPEADTAQEYVKALLEPFSESVEEAYHAFWDWYVIGGRWSGEHSEWLMKAHYGEDAVKSYWKEYEKKELGWTSRENPEASQKAKAVGLFKERFPEWSGKPIVGRNCYEENGYEDDIMLAEEIPMKFFSASTLIVPDLSLIEIIGKNETRFSRAELLEHSIDPYMLAYSKKKKYSSPRSDIFHKEIWNGSVHQKTRENFVEEIKKRGCHERGYFVTVDYHS